MENYYKEEAKSIPIIDDTDILVIGGGPAGLSAAVAAAREGASVILLERYGFLGGNITTAMVESMSWYRQEETVEAGGIGIELEQMLSAMGGAHRDMRGKGINMDADYFKIAADRMIEENHITPLYHCMAVAPMMEGHRVTGVITESKSGRSAIRSRVVIDASGDGDIAVRAGAAFRTGDEDGRMMGITTNFGVSAVDTDVFYRYIEEHPETIRAESHGLREIFRKAKSRGEWSSPRLIGAWHTIYEDTGEMTDMNFTMVADVDGTDIHDLTRAEIEGRKQVLECIRVLQKYQPGFESCRLRTLAFAAGVRETRHIRCDYSITGQDVYEAAKFEDSIGIFPLFIDDGKVMVIPNSASYFELPYRCLLPEHIDGLLVAGRCIDCRPEAYGAIREMMCCSVTGQAAGIAAAVAVQEKKPLREADVGTIQRHIREQGIRIH